MEVAELERAVALRADRRAEARIDPDAETSEAPARAHPVTTASIASTTRSMLRVFTAATQMRPVWKLYGAADGGTTSWIFDRKITAATQMRPVSRA